MEADSEEDDAVDTSWLEANLERVIAAGNKGIRCPCCTGRVAYEHRRLSKKMAEFLYKLVDMYRAESKPYSTRQVLGGDKEKCSTDGSFMKYWGLIEKVDPQGSDKGGTYYVPTELGEAFVDGTTRVPAGKWFLMGEPLDDDEDTVDVWEALKVPHGYEYRLGESPG